MMEERSVTRTGERLGLTQSAVSHALNRLRSALSDELFVRSADGMRPTPWAHQTAPAIAQALWQIQLALEPIDFTPQSSTRVFSIASTAYVSSTLLPTVVARCRQEAPLAEFDLRLWDRTMAGALDAGRIDLAIGPLPQTSERFVSEPLFDERMVWVMNLNHPQLEAARSGRLNPDRSAIVVSASDTAGLEGLDGSTGVEGKANSDLSGGEGFRANTMSAPDSHAAIAIAARSDIIAYAPARLAESYAERLPIALVPPPRQAETLRIRAAWRRDNSENPAISWLRSVLREESVKF